MDQPAGPERRGAAERAFCTLSPASCGRCRGTSSRLRGLRFTSWGLSMYHRAMCRNRAPGRRRRCRSLRTSGLDTRRCQSRLSSAVPPRCAGPPKTPPKPHLHPPVRQSPSWRVPRPTLPLTESSCAAVRSARARPTCPVEHIHGGREFWRREWRTRSPGCDDCA
jgi:hypothetical protein